MKFALFALAVLLGFTNTLAQNTVCPKYVVKPGDSLATIATKFSIAPPTLLDASLAACGQSAALLQIGQEICLPGADKPGCPNVIAFDGKQECKAYIVQQGDTINSVAESLGILNQGLQELNADVVAGGILQPGKYLKLPQWPQTCGDPNKSGESCRVYIVQEGDFVSGIATAFSVSIDDLLTVNPTLANGAATILQKSQPINIPPYPASCGAGIPTKPPTNTVIKCRGYQAQANDDLNTIATAFKTTVSELSNLNPELATAGIVKPGDVVKVPPYDSTCTDPILVPLPSSSTPSPSPPKSPSPPPSASTSPSPSPSPPILSPLPPSPTPVPAEASPPPTNVVASSPPPSTVNPAGTLTFPPPPSSPPSSSNAGVIAGAVIGGLLIVAAGAGGAWWWGKHRKQRGGPHLNENYPPQLERVVVAGEGSAVIPVTVAQPIVKPAATITAHPLTELPVTRPQDSLVLTALPNAAATRPEDSLAVTSMSSMNTSSDPILEWVASRAQGSLAPARSQSSIMKRTGSTTVVPAHVKELEFQWSDVRVLKPIGMGSFGKVFLAEVHHSLAAVKLLIDAKAVATASAGPAGVSHMVGVSEPSRQKLVEEIAAMAPLRHVNVALLVGYCMEPPCLATEYCARGSMFDVLQQAKEDPEAANKLTWERRVRMAADAAAGMLHLHTRSPQILHRDLKSPNLLVAADWTVKLADMGLSKLVDDATRQSSQTAGGASNPRWLAPEILEGERATAAGDAFSFGVVMWELLSWAVPWDGINAFAIPMKVTRGDRPPVPPIAELPGFGAVEGLRVEYLERPVKEVEAYIALMQRCWAQEPKDRPGFDVIAQELRSLSKLDMNPE